MNVDRLKKIVKRLRSLVENEAPKAVLLNALDNADAAVDELEARRQTHLNIDHLTVPPHWHMWVDDAGYAEKPYVRNDGLTICKLKDKSSYFAKFQNGQYVRDARGHRRFWKYVVTAMAYLDEDYPLSEDSDAGTS